MNSLPYYFLPQNTPMQHIFLLVFTSILLKNRKNMIIFCNFFSLCINKLEES